VCDFREEYDCNKTCNAEDLLVVLLRCAPCCWVSVSCSFESTVPCKTPENKNRKI